MCPYSKQQHQQLDDLVMKLQEGRIGRREFLRGALAIGLSASAAGALLEACGGGSSPTSSSPGSVDVLSV